MVIMVILLEYDLYDQYDRKIALIEKIFLSLTSFVLREAILIF